MTDFMRQAIADKDGAKADMYARLFGFETSAERQVREANTLREATASYERIQQAKRDHEARNTPEARAAKEAEEIVRNTHRNARWT
ncbi:hypothetical protein [Nocardia sp. NPDC051570]|uniref:hypothetical protein n=1 Tax=Nocardia sp. NPDC051570 TaxID=3364324 RepID=UPI0037B0D43E